MENFDFDQKYLGICLETQNVGERVDIHQSFLPAYQKINKPTESMNIFGQYGPMCHCAPFHSF